MGLAASTQRGCRQRLHAGPVTSSDALALAKQELLLQVSDTARGSRADKWQRGAIEEAQLAVETCSGGQPLDYALLAGRWRLLYTTASDVLGILALESTLEPPFGLPRPIDVTNIYQRFTAPDDNGNGVCENIIQLSAPFITEPPGVTLTVTAAYQVRSPHRIALRFKQASAGRINLSSGLQGLLAPAVLPRGWINHQLLLAIKEFNVTVPLAQEVARSAAQQPLSASSSTAGSGFAGYQITHLDEDMFIGRAIAPAGCFIFARDSP